VDDSGNPIVRPIKEYIATVTRRHLPSPTTSQHCDQEAQYRPGNYYIEVNTLPVSRFNVDVEMATVTEIRLPEPGFLLLTNVNAAVSIALYRQLYDAQKGWHFREFHHIDLDSGKQQRLQINSSKNYETHWKDKSGREHITKFEVRPNEIAEVDLRYSSAISKPSLA
jgi:hypothetical protein